MHLKKLNDRGFALITAIIFSTGLLTFAVAYVDLLLSERRLVQSSQNMLSSESLAEAGMEEAMWEYNYGGADFTGWTTSGTTRSKTGVSFTTTGGTTVGTYDVTVTGVGTTTPEITSVSNLSGVGGTALSSTVKSKLAQRARYARAITTKNSVTLSGNAYTDSYNSSGSTAYGGSNIAQNGDVSTNSTSTPAISLTGNAAIKGDAGTGSGGSISMTGNAYVTGSQSSSVDNAFTSNTTVAGGGSDYSGNGNGTAALTTGTYSSFSLSGNFVATVTGNVTLNITSTGSGAFGVSGNAYISVASGSTLTINTNGPVSLAGNGIVNSAVSTNVQAVTINGSGSAATVTLSGNGAFAGLVNTPDAAVTVTGNGAVYGAIIGSSFTSSGNGGVHYDENLATNGPGSGYKLDWMRKID